MVVPDNVKKSIVNIFRRDWCVGKILNLREEPIDITYYVQVKQYMVSAILDHKLRRRRITEESLALI